MSDAPKIVPPADYLRALALQNEDTLEGVIVILQKMDGNVQVGFSGGSTHESLVYAIRLANHIIEEEAYASVGDAPEPTLLRQPH